MMVNTDRRLVGIRQISQGTLDTLLVHPREVFRPAIAARAAAVIIAHNHPSGNPCPSEADIQVTRDLIKAGELLKIQVLDHIIMGRATQERPMDFMSLKALGYFYGPTPGGMPSSLNKPPCKRARRLARRKPDAKGRAGARAAAPARLPRLACSITNRPVKRIGAARRGGELRQA